MPISISRLLGALAASFLLVVGVASACPKTASSSSAVAFKGKPELTYSPAYPKKGLSSNSYGLTFRLNSQLPRRAKDGFIRATAQIGGAKFSLATAGTSRSKACYTGGTVPYGSAKKVRLGQIYTFKIYIHGHSQPLVGHARLHRVTYKQAVHRSDGTALGCSTK